MKMRKQLSKGRKLQGTRSLAKLAKTINARVRSEKKAAAALETTTEQRVPGPSKPKQTMPYSAHDRILLVGEANFSFMHALLVLFQDTPDEERGGLVGTSLDALDTLTEKYGEDCLEHIALCREAGYHVYHKVDAANLSAYKFLRNQRFSKIVFNFPHTGSGIKDKRLNILKQQALIQAFLESASSLLDPSHGEIHITTKTGDPYDLWDIKKIAKKLGLECKTSFKFFPELYPGYKHRRTLGWKEGVSADDNSEILKGGPPRTFCFTLPNQNKLEGKGKGTQSRDAEDSE
ncbi:MAG: hypothetical protein SGCHY_001507 [Lobulomycetales sp.]